VWLAQKLTSDAKQLLLAKQKNWAWRKGCNEWGPRTRERVRAENPQDETTSWVNDRSLNFKKETYYLEDWEHGEYQTHLLWHTRKEILLREARKRGGFRQLL